MNLITLDAKEAAKHGISADFVNGNVENVRFKNEHGVFHVKLRQYSSMSICKEEKITEEKFIVKGDGIFKEFKEEHEAKEFKNRYEHDDAPLTLEKVNKEITPEIIVPKVTETFKTEEVPF